MSTKQVSGSYSKRHKRRLANAESNVELFNLKKRILSKKTEIEKEYGHIFNVKNKSIIDDASCSFDSTNDFTYTKIPEKTLVNQTENNISSYSNESDFIKDDCIYHYSESDSQSVINEKSFSEDNTTEETVHSFKGRIKKWALDYNICQNALKALLQILNDETNTNFPKDPRTLLATPSQYEIISMGNGQYSHLGFKEAAIRIIDELNEIEHFKCNEKVLKLFISTDGAPLGKSSAMSMWPILCSSVETDNVQVVGIFVGENKPRDSNEFFEPLIKEIVYFQMNGLIHNEITYVIKIAGLIFDTPAKSFALNVKYHSGFNSCTKCKIYGKSIEHTVCFPDEYPEPNLRTDECFHNFKYSEEFDDDYQKEITIFTQIKNLGLVKCVPLDYMHLVCLGVMRKLLLLWLQGPLKNKLSGAQATRISKKLHSFRLSIPSDFTRKPRTLKYIKLWKATEFRSFLLYYGAFVLKNELNETAYNHYLMFHVAIHLLANPEAVKNPANIQTAKELLEKFVKLFGDIYGEKYVSYNVHNLKHLSEDVRNFGPLDGFSSFQFENYLCSLKRLIRTGANPLQQLIRRLTEFDHNITQHKHQIINGKYKFTKEHCEGPVTEDREYISQFRTLNKSSMYFNCDDDKNNHLLLKNKTIVKVFNFAKSLNNEYFIIGQKLDIVDDLYKHPYESRLNNIFYIRQTNQMNSWLCSEIIGKMFRLTYNGKHIVFPILHTFKQ